MTGLAQSVGPDLQKEEECGGGGGGGGGVGSVVGLTPSVH